MSNQTIILNNGQQAIINTDISKIFVWNNRYDNADYTNSTGAEVALPAGTVLGRVNATGQVLPMASGAIDGSQFPLGVLANDVTVADGVTIELFYCVAGDVEESKLSLDGSDTLDTIVDGRTYRDRIGADTVGIKLVAGKELSEYDNQ